MYSKKVQVSILEHLYFNQKPIDIIHLILHIKEIYPEITDNEIYANLNYLADYSYIIELHNDRYRIHVKGALNFRCLVSLPGVEHPEDSTQD